MTTTHNTRIRRIVRTAVFAGGLALAVSPFASLAVANAQYKESDFAACLERDMPTDYFCEHAGGVMRNGACINPDDLMVPSSGVFEQTPTTPTTRPPVVATVPTGVFEQVTTATPTPKPGSVVTAPITTATR
ncbi:hypothetical protein [Mycobacterium sp.]|uniref:hypothetical protein n=1 Tax=Mycobacterium sp. TaxID=1785 RepID=UPI003C759199